MGAVVGTVLAIAGTGKMLDPAPMTNILTVIGLPVTIATAITWCVPPLELACGLSLLRPCRPTRLYVTVMSMLALFCAFLVRLAFYDDTSSCQCFGRVLDNFMGSSVYLGLIRNAGLIGLLGLAMLFERSNVRVDIEIGRHN